MLNRTILFPQRRVDSSEMCSISPLAQFSAATLYEHSATLDNLRRQLEENILASGALSQQEAEATRRHNKFCDALQREEADLVSRITSTKRSHHELTLKLQDCDSLQKEEIIRDADTQADFRAEQQALNSLEAELLRIKSNIEQKLMHNSETARVFGKQFEDGLSLLEHDRQEAQLLASTSTSKLTVHTSSSNNPTASVYLPQFQISEKRHMVSPSRLQRGTTAESHPTPQSSSLLLRGTTVSPPRPPPPQQHYRINIMNGTPPLQPCAPQRFLSPSKAGRQHLVMGNAQSSNAMREIQQRSNTTTVPPPTVTISPPLSINYTAPIREEPSIMTVSGYLSQIGTHANHITTSPSNTAAPNRPSLLHDACERRPMNGPEVTELVRSNQDLVHATEYHSSNTPLHVACSNPDYSLDGIHAILLAGATATAQNAAGLTPFHLACLNCADNTSDHRLKRFLIFKGAQNPNQRTGKGETAAHLCAEDDVHLGCTKFLVSVGVDMTLTSLRGSSRMTPLLVARAAGGRAAQTVKFLEDQVKMSS